MTASPASRRYALSGLACAAALAVAAGGAAPASASWGWHDDAPRDDVAVTRAGRAVTIDPTRNDPRDAQVVAAGAAAHGTVVSNADGTFTYTPDAGFRGTDSFTYSTSDAVALHTTSVPPLATIGGTAITGAAYGSAVAFRPGSDRIFYGLTDRGPNVDGPVSGVKVEPLTGFTPSLGEFVLVDGRAVLLRTIPLRAADGTRLNGLVSTVADTGETIEDLDGVVQPRSPYGYDPEGLAVTRDGSFWVSDEYGPFITRFDRAGVQRDRLSPYDGTLPAELRHREPNKGMEGLTLTPDGRTLVGIMQAALTQPDSTTKSKNISFTRIVTVDLATRATHEYLYPLDDSATTGTAVSEITALSGTRFLVDERDGAAEPGATKKVYEIDLAGATDVGPASTLPTTRADVAYDASLGLTVGGRSLEANVKKADSPTVVAKLASLGVTPVSKTLALDLGALVTRLDPAGGFFGHDKVEGLALLDHGTKLLVSNDSDFGIDGLASATPPYTLAPKLQPNGRQDDGEYLVVDLAKVDDPTQSATVRVTVR